MLKAVDLSENEERGIPRPRAVTVIQEEIDAKVDADLDSFRKEFGIEITFPMLLELERIYGVHRVFYAITNYPDAYLAYLENPSEFPQKASQASLFEYNQK